MNLKFEHLLSQSSLRREIVAPLTMQAMYLIRTIQWCYVIRIIFPRNIFNFQSKDKNSNLGHWIVLKSKYNLNQITISDLYFIVHILSFIIIRICKYKFFEDRINFMGYIIPMVGN